MAPGTANIASRTNARASPHRGTWTGTPGPVIEGPLTYRARWGTRGAIEANTGQGMLIAFDHEGDIDVRTGLGDMQVFVVKPGDQITLSTGKGTVQCHVPGDIGCEVDARAEIGRIGNDFGFEVRSRLHDHLSSANSVFVPHRRTHAISKSFFKAEDELATILLQRKRLIPNPFKTLTSIIFYTKNSDFGDFTVYSIQGKTISTNTWEKDEKEYYTIIWDGSESPSGIYFYKIKSDEGIEITGKMILSK